MVESTLILLVLNFVSPVIAGDIERKNTASVLAQILFAIMSG
jgi:hypothetical protein